VEDDEEVRKGLDLEAIQEIVARMKIVSPLLWAGANLSSGRRAVPGDQVSSPR
jgi:hypothetical protein